MERIIEQSKPKIKLTEEIDSTIVDICKNIREGNIADYAATIRALAAMIEARDSLYI